MDTTIEFMTENQITLLVIGGILLVAGLINWAYRYGYKKGILDFAATIDRKLEEEQEKEKE